MLKITSFFYRNKFTCHREKNILYIISIFDNLLTLIKRIDNDSKKNALKQKDVERKEIKVGRYSVRSRVTKIV